MNGNDNGFIKNKDREKQRQNNVREYQRKFLNKKMKRGNKMVYKGLEIMQMISKGQIEDRTRFNFENNNFDGEVEYYNGTLYWIVFDEKWNETGKKNLFEMFNIQSTMVADFEPLEDKIDIDSIEELKSVTNNIDGTVCIMNKINELVQAVKQLNKEVKELENRK